MYAALLFSVPQKKSLDPFFFLFSFLFSEEHNQRTSDGKDRAFDRESIYRNFSDLYLTVRLSSREY